MSETMTDREILSVLQEPLTLESQPFAIYAKRLGMGVDPLLARIQEYLRLGVIRRIAGIVKHDRVGFLYNVMVAFEIDELQCDCAGEVLSTFSCISHCYRRSTYADWPYNLYAMVHAHNESEFLLQFEKIKSAVSFKSMITLPTVKEYKKSRYQMTVGTTSIP